MRGRPWTEAELEELRRRYPVEGGQRLAEDLGRPASSVYAQASSLGLKSARASIDQSTIAAAEVLFARGLTYAEIGRELGLHRNTVARHVLPDVRKTYRANLKATIRRRLGRRRCQVDHGSEVRRAPREG